MATPERVRRWDAANRERTNARKRAYKNRQKAKRDALRQSTTEQENDTK